MNKLQHFELRSSFAMGGEKKGGWADAHPPNILRTSTRRLPLEPCAQPQLEGNVVRGHEVAVDSPALLRGPEVGVELAEGSLGVVGVVQRLLRVEHVERVRQQ